MRAKIQECYYFLLTLIEAAGITFGRTSRTLRDRLDILIATVYLVLDVELLKKQALRNPAHSLYTAGGVP